MNVFFYLLAGSVVLLAVFAFGVLVGIADCKRRFQVPKGSVGVDANGNYIFS